MLTLVTKKISEGKLETLKESYFPKVTIKETTENIDNVETGPAQDIDVTGSMAAYSAKQLELLSRVQLSKYINSRK